MTGPSNRTIRDVEGDLTYWENSNLPIIVRTGPDEAWWRAVDEAFPDEAAL